MDHRVARDVVVIFLVAIAFLGSRKFPDLARVIGSRIRDFRKGTNEAYDEDEGLKEFDSRPHT